MQHCMQRGLLQSWSSRMMASTAKHQRLLRTPFKAQTTTWPTPGWTGCAAPLLIQTLACRHWHHSGRNCDRAWPSVCTVVRAAQDCGPCALLCISVQKAGLIMFSGLYKYVCQQESSASHGMGGCMGLIPDRVAQTQRLADASIAMCPNYNPTYPAEAARKVSCRAGWSSEAIRTPAQWCP